MRIIFIIVLLAGTIAAQLSLTNPTLPTGITTSDNYTTFQGTVMDTHQIPSVANGMLNPAGTVYTPTTGALLQAAFASANPGDTIILDHTVTYTMPTTGWKITYTGTNPNNWWILVKSDAVASLHPLGTRVFLPDLTKGGIGSVAEKSAYEPLLAHLVGNTAASYTMPLLTVNEGVSRWWFQGIEWAPAGIATCAYPTGAVPLNVPNCFIQSGIYINNQTTSPTQAMVFAGNYMHGHDGILTDATNNLGRIDVRQFVYVGESTATSWTLGEDNKNIAFIDSEMSEIHPTASDGGAIALGTSSGPFKFNNNFIQSTGEAIIVGGGGCLQGCVNPAPVPSDIEVQNNILTVNPDWLFVKDLTWQHPAAWVPKTNWECKSANRALVNGNILGPMWGWNYTSGNGSQEHGQSIRVTSRPSGNGSAAVCSNLTITNNASMANVFMELSGFDDGCNAPSTGAVINCIGVGGSDHILVKNNLFLYRDQTIAGANNYPNRGEQGDIQIAPFTIDIGIIHNTMWDLGVQSGNLPSQAPGSGSIHWNNADGLYANFPIYNLNNGGSGYVANDTLNINATNCDLVAGVAKLIPLKVNTLGAGGAATTFVSNGGATGRGQNCFAPATGPPYVTHTAVSTTTTSGTGSGITMDVTMTPVTVNTWILGNVLHSEPHIAANGINGYSPVLSNTVSGSGNGPQISFMTCPSQPGSTLASSCTLQDATTGPTCRYSNNKVYVGPPGASWTPINSNDWSGNGPGSGNGTNSNDTNLAHFAFVSASTLPTDYNFIQVAYNSSYSLVTPYVGGSTCGGDSANVAGYNYTTYKAALLKAVTGTSASSNDTITKGTKLTQGIVVR